MKALTLYQPWAILIPLGAKTIETRPWKTNYRGQLAIHAAKIIPYKYHDLRYQEPFCKYIPDVPLPLGAVVAVCTLADCVPTEKIVGALVQGEKTKDEYYFGNYEPGRFAWILQDIKPLPEPIPARGRQGLWNWEPPEGV